MVTFDPTLQHWNKGTAQKDLCRVVDEEREGDGAEMGGVAEHYLEDGDTWRREEEHGKGGRGRKEGGEEERGVREGGEGGEGKKGRGGRKGGGG